MKRGYFALCLATLFIAGLVVAQDQEAARSQIRTSEIRGADVIGDLGVPLGQCCLIKAKTTRSKVNSKGSWGRYYLEVTHVDGRRLAAPVVYDFDVDRRAKEKIDVASNDYELYELRMGKKASSLTGDMILKLEKGYVGTPVTLVVYETGGFGGKSEPRPETLKPGQLPPFGADERTFGFQTYLSVMEQHGIAK